ncbi:hypothetical protein QR680_019237 [Steinernema hermaphroditum]|uniref:Uncharacterized protein n=1 Tax=Steinernema hermaphroditum TaxID=289476 RepID=A0AA39HMQ3_9BILA|nr:hypothetical protein QR680_019237 [Steinernema hermaphroditum]
MRSLLLFLLLVSFWHRASCTNVTECYKYVAPGDFTAYLGTDTESLFIAQCSLPNGFCILMTDYTTMRYQDCLSNVMWQIATDPTKYDHNDLKCVIWMG